MVAFLLFAALLFSFPSMLTGEMRTTPAAPPGRVAKSPGRATLSLKSMQPVVVAGHGFQPGESVRISGIGTKRVRASTAGTFSVNLGGAVERCSGFSLFAVGSQGSRASLDFSRPLCPMQ